MSRISRHTILLKELFPFTFVVLIWLIHVIQGFLETSWADYSLFPRTLHGLAGIFTSPMLHADWGHLLGNTVPLILLGLLLFNNYKEISGKVFWLVYFSNGILLWSFAREAFHLGASGVVYGIAFFLIFSGFIRKIPRLTMISFLIIFLYGSMVWGVFPFDPHVSWEAHLYGAITGLVLAIALRKEGPQPAKYWNEEENEEREHLLEENEEREHLKEEREKEAENAGEEESTEKGRIIHINYEYKEKE
jgi:membrane associated rhomboid family serine protease